MRLRVAEEELSLALQTEKVIHPRDNSYIRASGIGQCRRQLAYRLLWHQEQKEEGPIWSHGLATFDFGHSLHYRLQTRLSNVGTMKWLDAEPCLQANGEPGWRGNCEIALKNDEHQIAGHCDGLTRPLKIETREGLEFLVPTGEDDPEGVRYILDIKTITARERVKLHTDPESGYLRGAEIKPSAFEKLLAPKDEHIAQVSLYAWMTTQPGFQTDRIAAPLPVLPDLMVIYVAKDLDPDYYGKKADEYEGAKHLLNSPYKVFAQKADPKLIQAQLRKVAGIWGHLENGTLPPRDHYHRPERPSFYCTDCFARASCYSAEGYFTDEDTTLPAKLEQQLIQLKDVAVVRN